MTGEMIGRTFGDFAVKERLGAGGAGEVYLAEQLALGRQAVIKVMGRETASSPDAQERFLREARLASRLDHPFAAHVYAFGAESEGTLWIAMELVRGTPLDRLVATQGPVSLARFVPLFERLCEVLNAAHEQDIVHRDIKPANVMVLQRAGKLLPKLLDLGIARATVVTDGSASLDPDSVPGSSLGSTATPVSLVNISQGVAPAEIATMSGSLSGRLTRSESMHLTQLGSIVGTPHYMAPEQWADASRAGAKADIYSLSILAFQCLTGRVPFDAKTLKAMAKAHSSQQLPPLPEGLPEALHAVLSKGAAKKAEGRYSTPLEFAAALRGASGLGVEPVALPQLDEGLRDNILSEAPQPLAESVASLEGARTARRAVEAASMVLRVLCRYLGIVALAARVRVGPGGPRDGAEVAQLLARLRDVGLLDAEWLDLTRLLAAPFKSKPEAHPLPELVRYFADAADRAVDALLQTAAPSKEASEDACMQQLLKVVPKLSSVLERASFLFDYALVVQAAVPERWTGTRRLERLPVAMVTPAKKGEVLLVDAVGSAVVTLPPLMQCIAPSGGAPEEMFLLEGPGRHGAKLVALPSPFERQDESLWQWMVQQGLLPEATGAAVATEKVPYKGLSTFGSDDADNYFGREKEAEAFANRMRKESFLAVVGPSGTGKSSFILAGVLPLLPKGWKPVVMRPGATPTLPKEASEDFGEGHLVLVVDQFEELVTLCQDSVRRSSFAAQLLELSRHSSGRVRVVVTLRDDFLIKVQQLPAFRETLSNSLQLLGTPAPEDLQRVVTEPARRVGYAFDDAQLPKRMVEAVSEYPGALALLSFTASQLWELRDRHLRLMRVKTYDALGGVGGALANHAEATLASLSDEEQKLVREAFRHLVTAQGTRAVLTKKEALEVLGATPAASTVLEKLVTARLLVSSETADGNDSIEVIHEALITAWPRLVGWQREDAESARLRDSLRASARQWEERGRPSGLLWRKETLTEYRVWRARFPGRLTQLEESFAGASIRDEARAQLIRRSLAIAAFVALSVGLVVIFRAYRDSEAKMVRLREEQARLAVLNGKPNEAIAYLEATGIQNPGAGHRFVRAYAEWLAPLPPRQWAVDRVITRASYDDTGNRALVFNKLGTRLLDLESMQSTTLPGGEPIFVGQEVWLPGKGQTLTITQPDGGSRTESTPVRFLGLRTVDGLLAVTVAETEMGVGRLHDTWVTFPLSGQYQMVQCLSDARGDRCICISGPWDTNPLSLRGAHVFEGSEPVMVGGDRVIRSATFVGSDLVLGGDDGLVQRVGESGSWSARTSEAAIHLRTDPDKDRLAVMSESGLEVLRLSTGERIWRHSSTTRMADLRWFKDTLLVGTSDGRVTSFEGSSGVILGYRYSHLASVMSISVSDRGYLSADMDGETVEWETPPRFSEPLGSDAIGLWGWPWERTGAIAKLDGWYSIDAEGAIGASLRSEPLTKTEALAYGVSRDGSHRGFSHGAHLTVTSNAGSLELEAPAPISDIWFSDDGGLVAVDLEGEAAGWARTTPPFELHEVKLDDASMGRGTFTPDGRFLAIGSTRGSLLVLAVDGSGTPERNIKAHTIYAEVRDTADPSTFLTVGYDGRIVLWNRRTIEQKAQVTGLSAKILYFLAADWDHGVVSTVAESGEWLVVDTERDVIIASTPLGFRVRGAAALSESRFTLLVTTGGQLVRTPRRLTASGLAPRLEMVDERLQRSGAQKQ